MRPGFHVSNLDRSPAQRRVLAYLRDKGASGATTAQISRDANVQNVATWVSHLKANGIDVVCRYEGETEDGARVYRYWLAAMSPAEPERAA